MPADPGGPLVALCYLRGRLFERVEWALAEQAPDYQPWPDVPGDPHSYPRHLARLLSAGRDLIICEGDVLPAPGSIGQLLDCPSPWCAFSLWLGERYTDDTLGLCRFSGSLVHDYPGWPWRALLAPPSRGGLVHVRSVDAAISRWLRSRGLRPHRHDPPPLHLRYPSDPLLSTRLPGYRPPDRGGVEDVRRQ